MQNTNEKVLQVFVAVYNVTLSQLTMVSMQWQENGERMQCIKQPKILKYVGALIGLHLRPGISSF